MKKNLIFLIPLLIAFTLPVLAIPRAVVFDFGGVITQEADHSSRLTNTGIAFIKKCFSLSDSEFAEMNHQRLLVLKQGGSDEPFLNAFAQQKGISLPDDWYQSFKSTMLNAAGVDEEMWELVNELKQHIQVGLLSNADAGFASLLRDCGIYEPFDPCLLSAEIGIRKPDLKAYQFLLSKLDLPPEDVIFIDDKLENVNAAKQLGIDGILFQSPAQLKAELTQREVLAATVP
jgi:epoxide hydrolase-like predicted phosphatase